MTPTRGRKKSKRIGKSTVGKERSPASNGISPSEDGFCWRFLERRKHEGRSYGNSALYATPQTIPSLVRETGQNSLDAAVQGKSGKADAVLMRYTLFDLPHGSRRRERLLKAIRFNDQLRLHIASAAEGGGERQTAVRLAAGLKEIDAGGSVLRVLRIEDFGGRGLAGPEFGPDGPFSALVRDVENSAKQDQTAGGSFGLGAKTLWSCSKVLTVMFSSIVHGDEGKGVRVVGKADLGFHAIESHAKYGFVGAGIFGRPIQGESDGARSEFLPETSAFLRDSLLARIPPAGEGRKHGTTALILAFHDPTSDDEDSEAILQRVSRGIAENFWPAILNGQLRSVVEHVEGDASEPTSSRQIDPDDFVPSFADAFRKHLANRTKDRLEAPGDVVSVPIQLIVPATRPEGQVTPKHAELTAECRLVIRLAEPSSPDAYLVDNVGYARGRAMITQYQERRGVAAGARPFHAVLLAGRLVGASEEQEAAEKFLRYSEPPSHDMWHLWSGVKARYAHGAGKKLGQLFASVSSKLSEFVAAPPAPSDEAPAILQRLFRMPNSSPAKRAKWKLINPSVERIGGEIRVTAMVEVDKSKACRVTPRLAVAKESGKGAPAEWIELESEDATVEGGALLVEKGMKLVRFSGRALATLKGLDLEKCAVELSVAYATGADEP